MLTWERPQKIAHVKERIFPVILRYWNPKSVHGALRYPRSFFVFFYKKIMDRDPWYPFKETSTESSPVHLMTATKGCLSACSPPNLTHTAVDGGPYEVRVCSNYLLAWAPAILRKFLCLDGLHFGLWTRKVAYILCMYLDTRFWLPRYRPTLGRKCACGAIK